MNLREALRTMSPSLTLQRAAADEIARLDAQVRALDYDAGRFRALMSNAFLAIGKHGSYWALTVTAHRHGHHVPDYTVPNSLDEVPRALDIVRFRQQAELSPTSRANVPGNTLPGQPGATEGA